MLSHNMNMLRCLILTLIALLFGSCGGKAPQINSLADAARAKIGVMTGSSGEQLTHHRFPDAKIKSFDDIMDAVAALKSDQLDAVVTTLPTTMNVCKRNKDLRFLDEAIDYENTAIGLKKGNEALLNNLNAFIQELEQNGTLRDMKRRWFKMDLSPYEEVQIPVPQKGEALMIGVSATREPFCFLDANRKVTGYDGEISQRLSAWLKRPVQFVDMKFSALITSLQAGKIDLIITGMSATEERKKSIDFSIPYFKNSQVMIVKKRDAGRPSVDAASLRLRTQEDVWDKKLGILLGSSQDNWTMKYHPGAVVLQYKTFSELLLAVRSGKVDAGMYATEMLGAALRADPELQFLGDTLFAIPIAMGFGKESPRLREQFNTFLRELQANGVYNDMCDRWFVRGNYLMPEVKIGRTNGTLVVGNVSDKGLPFTALREGKLIGFDIEMCQRFAAAIGKELKIQDMEFGSLIIAAATKKIDMIASTLGVTEERKQQIDFSDIYYRLGSSVFVLRKNIVTESGLQLRSLDDIATRRIAVYAGTVHDVLVVNKYPKADIKRYNNTADMILSLKTGKTDVAYFDLLSAKVFMKLNSDLGLLDDNVYDLPIAMGFSKQNPALRERFNEFLKWSKANGQFDSVYRRWFVDDPEQAQMPPFVSLKGAPVVLVGIAVGDLPYAAYLHGRYAGFDVELLECFARTAHLDLKFVTMDFGALVAALSSGKVDIITDGICITEERQKKVDFSDSHFSMKTAVLALKANLANQQLNPDIPKGGGSSFFESIARSFHSNIIVEHRYLLILDGLKTTAVISLFSIVFGSILGSLVCFMRMSKRGILQVPAKLYIALLRGTPVLVVLMIIFYVVFASVDIDPVLVAVIAFGMNFAAYVSEMFRTGIEGVDRGQTEAGIAMGFTKVATFVFIVLPQAARRILPVYKGEVISLVKMTSIVGYIAVQDLTKASDIIRSRTFDAFFPLIMVAVLYFLISWLLMILLGYGERLSDPKTSRRARA
jgi:polar amino acid transport system substrate-binding protein